MATNESRPTGFRRISTRLVFWIVLVSVTFQLPLALFDYFKTRETVLDAVRDKGRYLVTLNRARIDARRHAVERSTNTFAAVLSQPTPVQPSLLHNKLRSFLRANRSIFGSSIALRKPNYAPYFFRGSDGQLSQQDLANEDYDYHNKDWFKIPVEEGRSTWSEPYFDEGGGEIRMTTYSAPFFSRGEIAGVVTADLSLRYLEQIAAAAENAEAGYCFIVARSGKFLYHPSGAHLDDKTIGGFASEHGSSALQEVASELAAGKSGFVRTEHELVSGRPGVLAYDSDPESGWALVVFLDQDDLLGGLTQLTWIRAIVGLAGLLALIGIVVFASRRITRPLQELSASANEIAKGELARPIPEIQSRDEIGTLWQSFSRMRDDLQQHVTDLTTTTAAKQKLESELAVAHQIQLAMVPGNGDAHVDDPRFQLSAKLIPARAVGGDWYDYFHAGEDRLIIVIGDVSDKGVPAALLMSKTVSSIRSAGHHLQPPEKILAEANAEFSHDNDACMFATIFCAVLDLTDGKLNWASAGHNPPALLAADGSVRYLDSPASLPIGLSASSTYQSNCFQLNHGDTLVLYTDGVTEAFDPQRKLYGEDRLLKTIANSGSADPSTLSSTILGSVSDFANGANQSDDITLLTFKYLDPQMTTVSRTFKGTSADTAALKQLRLELVDFLGSHLGESGVVDDAATITAEVLDNLLEHTPADEAFEVRAEIQEGALELRFVDRGPAFNPLAPPSEPDKEIGGHGLTIVKAMATALCYERSPSGENILTAEIEFDQNEGC